MALSRSSVSRRGSKNDSQKDDDDAENNGYIQVLVKPLEQGNYSLILNWFGLNEANHFTTQHAGIVYGILLLFSSVTIYQLLRCDVGFIFQKVCGLLVPLFTIICAFYWLSLYLRKTWTTTSVYLLFSSCFVGESLAQLFLASSWGPFHYEGSDEAPTANITQPLVIFVVLLAVCAASVLSSIETTQSALVISLVSFGRYLACANLGDLPQSLRPYLAYSCGLAGFIVSKYMETVLKPQINDFMTSDGKIPVIRRRRSSSSNASAFSAHRSTRRTSLPALIPKSQSSSSSYESAIIGEAHGLITDMLADSSLPPHVVSGLRAVSNLLTPAENHPSIHKTRVSPLVSLTESTIYGSDTEENPYTGERPSTLPKRLRRSLPPSLIRRMSTSTWTTTTSATGMPTLEPEPCRVRSSSFRHSRDTTPGSSPAGSRSNSPSPSSPTVVLTIPKSRSFSLAATTQSASSNNHVKRLSRKSMTPLSTSDNAVALTVSKPEKSISPLVKSELDPDSDREDSRMKMLSSSKEHFSPHIRKLNITSDYESNDSPSSSDHSDNIPTSDELLSASPPKKGTVYPSRAESSCTQSSQIVMRNLHDKENYDESKEAVADDEDEGEDDDAEIVNIKQNADRKAHVQTIVDKNRTELLDLVSQKNFDSRDKLESSSSTDLLFDVSELDNVELLQIHRLVEWDYPVFELSDLCGNFILSKVAYKLFMEVGLFETFRIPVGPFINYFHALELGYRDKPYHNRVHATDVLHGVYYLSTQPIPGFTQINTADIFSRQGSSSESGEVTERTSFPHHCGSAALMDDSYGIMGGNFPPLELMALFTAAAMHDYDHPGRTNAFLVATHAPQAVLYNDRSVLENYHAASAWNLFLSKAEFNFLSGLDNAEFKRFRYLVIEAILATDLKRHFEILAEFNAKVNDDDAPGIDWSVETDRMLVAQMVIKLADINGPAKRRELHTSWTMRIAEEFYEQGDEESSRGMQISPYMDRRNPQLAKLQETFINHLVAPLCNCMVTAGLLPGTWVDEDSDDEAMSDTEKGDSTCKDTEDETDTDVETGTLVPKPTKKTRKVNCLLTKNMKDNHVMWVAIIKEEEQQKALAEKLESIQQESTVASSTTTSSSSTADRPEMEPIKEESESPSSLSPINRQAPRKQEEPCTVDTSKDNT